MENKYTLDQLSSVYKTFWKPGWGSIATDEVLFVQDLIEQYRPKDFLEIGMASGLSGGIISQMLDWADADTFTSIDYDNTFFGDKNKENGFLIEEIYKGTRIKPKKLPFTISPDLSSVGQQYDMSFIDANHQQPWPMIDTLCLFPFLKNEKIIVHHDLKLFKTQEVVYGIGPKYLFDQFPEKYRITSQANGGNIFAIRLKDIARDELETIAINTFSLPWSLRNPLADDLVEKVSGIFSAEYSPKLSEHFLKCVKKFNNLERLRTGV